MRLFKTAAKQIRSQVIVRTEMGKAADPADISVLFFPAGANFWHMHAQYDAGTSAISTGHWWF